MPTYRPTNAGLQTKGSLLGGFDPATTAILSGVFLGSVLTTFGSISMLHASWYIIVPCFLLAPNLAVLFVLFTLVIGKPKRYLRDWFESRVLGLTEVNASNIHEPVRLDLE